MWRSPTTITVCGRELSGLDAWVYVFARTWESIEQDPGDLYIHGFNVFGYAVAQRHGDEEPALVAKRLFPDAGEYPEDIYPAHGPRPSNPTAPALAAWPPLDGDVPF